MYSQAALPPKDFHELSSEDKLSSILERMNVIYDAERKRFWRVRLASPEQYAEEYPESYDKDMAVAFRLIKDNYNRYFDDINEVAKKIGDNDYFRILKTIVEQDIEDVLLGDQDEAE